MDTPLVLIDHHDGFYTLTINRPEALNALNKGVFDELEAFFKQYMGDFSVKGVIITGAGQKAFVAGADIKEFAALDTAAGSALSKRGQDVFFMMERFHAPVIAAVNGFALGGGCELAMSCHIRVAGQHAKFGQPEVNLGLVPGYGGSQRLIQLIGKGKAIEMLLTADMIGADEALRLGLVTHVVDAGMETAKAMEILQKIATKGPLAVQHSIQLVNAYFDKSVDGFEKEYKDFGKTIGSADSKEGAAAFVEKRKPVFKAQ
ncbi:MAG: enoyl-CoA hydratase/isomerase family protein [Saprospiraceae bacterium]|nr:MAG: enoyl-CoA hydratase/isomerase [Bacteroidetes bacterium OLB9]MCO6464785.1 enoyl-CoA hydratase/isomerase family protein [Saprospiraceae bacterium]MCZ2338442.1 enoyl-CoA hydratase/isomerase family protein [Chitinophagales bacterium]